MAEQLRIDWTLDPLEARVLHALSTHRGRANAIRVDDLAREVGRSGRDLQEIVHRLRVDHGKPIASAASKPAGYYIPESLEEVEAFVAEQRAKALGTLAAIAAVKRVTLAELLGQLSLEAA